MNTFTGEKIIKALPYASEFCFVDNIDKVDSEQISGYYTFQADRKLYQAHITHKPIVPGALLLECMGQIGLVSHGIYLMDLYSSSFTPALSHVDVEFLHPVLPGDTVRISGTKTYLRNGRLRSSIKAYHSESDKLLARASGLCQFQINQENQNDNE